ncbi:MAG: hypothetical protein IT245_01815, partial [Bacteroidia bacterium]|nr:hypothetical protein [Bacteroidia bacterium]
MTTAIIIFAFNRPGHLKQSLEFLSLNTEVTSLPIYFFIDGPQNPAEVEQVLAVKHVAESFKANQVSIIASDVNLGLKRSVISGISKVFESYDQAIILEDDICVAPNFIQYHLNCLKS